MKKQQQHWGLFFLLFVLIQEEGKFVKAVSTELVTNDGFISTRGVNLILNGYPFYANGFNAYWLMVEASDPSQRYKITTAFQQAVLHALTVARTWAFSDGGSVSALQFSPGVYNEHMFQGLDFVISEARKFGVRLILSLVNNYDDYGGRKQYVQWARDQGQQIASDDDFYSNNVVKGFYKNHIMAVLTRKNTITGIAYKDDPTIMAWELINEPRCASDLSGSTIQAWITEMASFLKSIDNRHLLEAGLEGFYGPDQKQLNPNSQLVGTDFISNNQIPGIDFATVHSYPDQWLPNSDPQIQLVFLQHWANIHIQDSQQVLKKPVLFGEFGKSWKDQGFSIIQRDQQFNLVYSAILSSASSGGAAFGGMFWQLLLEGMDNFHDGYEIILSESSSTVSLITQQSQKLENVHRMSAMQD